MKTVGLSFWKYVCGRPRPRANGLESYFLASQVFTTYFEALSPSDLTASSLETSVPSSKTTVATWVPASSPFSIEMDLKPLRLPNAELTSFLQPPHVTPVMPAR
jgi:hypothetical protein